MSLSMNTVHPRPLLFLSLHTRTVVFMFMFNKIAAIVQLHTIPSRTRVVGKVVSGWRRGSDGGRNRSPKSLTWLLSASPTCIFGAAPVISAAQRQSTSDVILVYDDEIKYLLLDLCFFIRHFFPSPSFSISTCAAPHRSKRVPRPLTRLLSAHRTNARLRRLYATTHTKASSVRARSQPPRTSCKYPPPRRAAFFLFHELLTRRKSAEKKRKRKTRLGGEKNASCLF